MIVKLDITFKELIELHNVVERMSCSMSRPMVIIDQLIEYLKKGDQ